MNEMTFADRLYQLRTTLQLNQKDFCAAVNISQGRLSDFEAGKNKPSFSALQTIAEAYSVSLDWLVLGIGDMFRSTLPSSKDQSLKLSNDEITLVSKYHELTERQKGRVDQQVDNYLAENKKLSHSIVTENDPADLLA